VLNILAASRYGHALLAGLQRRSTLRCVVAAMRWALALGSARQMESSAAITPIRVQRELGTSGGQGCLQLGRKAPFLDADAKPGAHGSLIASAESGSAKGGTRRDHSLGSFEKHLHRPTFQASPPRLIRAHLAAKRVSTPSRST
jgi:hypothetical protein